MSPKKPLDLSRYGRNADTAARSTALDALLAAAPAEAERVAQELGFELKQLPTEQIAPDPQQIRRLPHPSELTRMAEKGDHAAQTILADLRALGQSMRELGQIQPIIVYPESGDPAYPRMTHRILVGQRRWSAAILEQLPTLRVIVAERPSNVQRVQRQYDENEQREDLSDMERAWALQSLKAARDEIDSGATWAVIEAQVQISTQRRQDLLRLLRFSEEGQAIIARYRWPESVIRPIHMAISSGELEAATATAILRELTALREVQARTVHDYLQRYRRQAAHEAEHGAEVAGATSPVVPAMNETTARLIGMPRQLGRFRKGIEKLAAQVEPDIDEHVRAETLREIDHLMKSLEALLQRLDPTSD